MNAFIAGAIFGLLFAGGIAALFMTRVKLIADDEDEWDYPPFETEDRRAPAIKSQKLVTERTFQ